MLLIGKCEEKIDEIESESIQAIITSPPYWGLRDYEGEDAQIGQESAPELFINNLVIFFNKCKRVLKSDGTLWVNIGDTYFGPKGGHWDSGNSITNSGTGSNYRMKRAAPPKHKYLKNGDLCGVPWNFAIAMQRDGWYLKNDIIWNKPNPMPEAVNNRCCKAHEYIFLFTKNKDYFFNADALRDRVTNVRKTDVWTINTSQYKGAHFAVFPKELPAECIKAGTKEGDIVLDPFMGSGTTAEVASKLGRKWVGIELSSKYAAIIKQRTAQGELF